jgi:hypothetical protein
MWKGWERKMGERRERDKGKKGIIGRNGESNDDSEIFNAINI